MPSNSCINSTQRIIQEKNVCVCVERPGQADPCPLTSTQTDPAVTDQGAVSVRHDLQILKEAAWHAVTDFTTPVFPSLSLSFLSLLFSPSLPLSLPLPISLSVYPSSLPPCLSFFPSLTPSLFLFISPSFYPPPSLHLSLFIAFQVPKHTVVGISFSHA